MGRLCTLFLTVAVAASAWAELPPNVAKNAKAAKVAASAPSAKRTGKSKPPATKSSVAKLPPAPEPQPTPAQPVVPLRPSQLPSVPPRVSFQQGQLTVIAENSTLGDIFGAIRNATGIKIETQGGPSGDRVAAKIGPAPTREVLLSLLQGSRYDYVMLGSLNDPEQVERVILTPKTAGGTVVASGPAQPQAPLRQEPPEVDQDSSADENAEEDTGPPPVRGPDRPQPEQPGAVVQPNQQQNAPANQNPNGQVKTPEQLLQELRDRQQQQQQQQQQGQQPYDPNRPR